MGSLSATYDNHALDSILGSDHSSRFPATVYVALFTVMPTKTTFGTECVIGTGAYARVAVANDDAHWPDAVSATKSNLLAITFPTLTAAWGTIVGYAIMDHATTAASANIIAFNALVAPVTPIVGATPEFPIGALVIEAA